MKTYNSQNLDEAKQYIYAIDFSSVINKMVQHLGWRQQDVEKVCQLYRNFIFLQKKYGMQYSLVPSDEIDEFWHNHILDTKKYRSDCDVIFGQYNDHYPYFGIDGKSDLNDLKKAFQETQNLHIKEFGYSIERVRKLKLTEILPAILRAIKVTMQSSN